MRYNHALLVKMANEQKKRGKRRYKRMLLWKKVKTFGICAIEFLIFAVALISALAIASAEF